MAKTKELPPETTLAQARAWLAARVSDGASCPCCERFNKLYTRKLKPQMVHALATIYMLALRQGNQQDGWVGVGRGHDTDPKLALALHHAEYGKLVHFGLLVPAAKGVGDRRNRSGFWRPTLLGIRFLRGKANCLTYVKLLHNRQVDQSEEEGSARALLGDAPYAELMKKVSRFEQGTKVEYYLRLLAKV